MPEQEFLNDILDFLISLKSVRKRHGEEEPFQLEKLERSIASAFVQSGKHDDFLTRSISEQVIQELQKTCDGFRTPTTQEIRSIVIAALSQHGLSLVIEAYNSPRPEKIYAPTPSSMPPSSFEPAPISSTAPAMPTPSMGEVHIARRRRLNEERKAITHKFQIGAHEGYLIVGLYDDGQPGEIFLNMNKEGSVLSGLMDSFATAVSIGLQYGVPLKVFVRKFAYTRFEPNGPTQNPNIPVARSVMDYIFRWLALKFLTPEERQSMLGSLLDDDAHSEIPIEVLNVDGARQSRLLDTTSTS